MAGTLSQRSSTARQRGRLRRRDHQGDVGSSPGFGSRHDGRTGGDQGVVTQLQGRSVPRRQAHLVVQFDETLDGGWDERETAFLRWGRQGSDDHAPCSHTRDGTGSPCSGRAGRGEAGRDRGGS